MLGRQRRRGGSIASRPSVFTRHGARGLFLERVITWACGIAAVVSTYIVIGQTVEGKQRGGIQK
jgi:hypothetical protein